MRLFAEIKPGNLASRRIAGQAGFVLAGAHDGLEIWRLTKA
jgi:RimJ/RimL family protein N-acetyltransferase